MKTILRRRGTAELAVPCEQTLCVAVMVAPTPRGALLPCAVVWRPVKLEPAPAEIWYVQWMQLSETCSRSVCIIFGLVLAS